MFKEGGGERSEGRGERGERRKGGGEGNLLTCRAKTISISTIEPDTSRDGITPSNSLAARPRRGSRAKYRSKLEEGYMKKRLSPPEKDT